jgi:hypothetical protein
MMMIDERDIIKESLFSVFNKNTPPSCKPFETSFSEGCPPGEAYNIYSLDLWYIDAKLKSIIDAKVITQESLVLSMVS